MFFRLISSFISHIYVTMNQCTWSNKITINEMIYHFQSCNMPLFLSLSLSFCAIDRWTRHPSLSYSLFVIQSSQTLNLSLLVSSSIEGNIRLDALDANQSNSIEYICTCSKVSLLVSQLVYCGTRCQNIINFICKSYYVIYKIYWCIRIFRATIKLKL